jgi:predicted metal-dependent phosphoesterase TrpH
MSYKIDLHIHSNKSSDGDFSPFHIVQLAKQSALKAISITDHDTVAAYPEAIEFGIKSGVEVIPSIELTTHFESREFHLLLPFLNWEEKTVFDLIDKVTESRFKEARERVRKLKEIGFDISWKEVLKKTKPKPPLGVTIAQILLDKAEKKKDPAFRKYFERTNRLFAPYIFYKDYFMKRKPAYVTKQNVSLLEVLKVAPKTEGVPVLAHPGAYFEQAGKEDLMVLKEHGLIGLEVYTTYHDPPLRDYYKKIAQELDLVPTAGSDFHGRIKPHIPFGSLEEGEYWMVEELRKRRK